jgi:hypothetical protein
MRSHGRALMTRAKCFLLISLLICSNARTAEKADSVPQSVTALMALLTAQRAPTLADFNEFYGPNAEDETMLLLKYCDAKSISRDDCVKISNLEAMSPTKHMSRYFSWIRDCYHTIGHNWDVLDKHAIEDKSAVVGAIYTIRLNNDSFKIQYVFPGHRYDGLAVAIFQINDKNTKELLKNSAPKCVQQRHHV